MDSRKLTIVSFFLVFGFFTLSGCATIDGAIAEKTPGAGVYAKAAWEKSFSKKDKSGRKLVCAINPIGHNICVFENQSNFKKYADREYACSHFSVYTKGYFLCEWTN